MWFDLFRALGVDHKILESIRQRFPFDSDASLFEAINEWLRASQEEASWNALVSTLRSKMLEAKLADTIAEKHLSAKDLANYKQSETFDVVQ